MDRAFLDGLRRIVGDDGVLQDRSTCSRTSATRCRTFASRPRR